MAAQTGNSAAVTQANRYSTYPDQVTKVSGVVLSVIRPELDVAMFSYIVLESPSTCTAPRMKVTKSTDTF